MEDNAERKPGERFLIWFLLALGLFVFIAAWFMPRHTLSDSGAFPLFIGAVMILSVLRILWKERKIFASWKWREERALIKPFAFPKDVTVYIAVLTVYILLTMPLGFWVSSYLFLIGSFLLLKGAKLGRALVIGVVMLAVIWLLFQYIFRIILW
jgi:putative tricarboxylic transport membrane protein